MYYSYFMPFIFSLGAMTGGEHYVERITSGITHTASAARGQCFRCGLSFSLSSKLQYVILETGGKRRLCCSRCHQMPAICSVCSATLQDTFHAVEHNGCYEYCCKSCFSQGGLEQKMSAVKEQKINAMVSALRELPEGRINEEILRKLYGIVDSVPIGEQRGKFLGDVMNQFPQERDVFFEPTVTGMCKVCYGTDRACREEIMPSGGQVVICEDCLRKTYPTRYKHAVNCRIRRHIERLSRTDSLPRRYPIPRLGEKLPMSTVKNGREFHGEIHCAYCGNCLDSRKIYIRDDRCNHLLCTDCAHYWFTFAETFGAHGNLKKVRNGNLPLPCCGNRSVCTAGIRADIAESYGVAREESGPEFIRDEEILERVRNFDDFRLFATVRAETDPYLQLQLLHRQEAVSGNPR